MRSAWLACSLIASAAAAQPADGLYAGSYVEHPSPRTIVVAYGSSTAHARLGRRLPAPIEQTLTSSANDNTRYAYSVSMHPRDCAREPVLIIDGAAVSAPSTGIGSGQCRYDFGVDRATADRIAAAFGVARTDRVPIGERVQGSFRIASTSNRIGDPVTVVLVLSSPGAPIQREVGCHRFDYRILRDGQPVEEHQGPGLEACPVGLVELAATGEDSTELGGSSFATAGHYRIELRYYTTFAAIGTQPYTNGGAGVWDRVFAGAVELDVR